MAWIETVPADEATGTLSRIYEACLSKFGFIPNIRRSMSLDPTALRAYIGLSNAVYAGGPLPVEEREMVATVVSALNDCHY